MSPEAVAQPHGHCPWTGISPSGEGAGWGLVAGRRLTSMEKLPHFQQSYGRSRELWR